MRSIPALLAATLLVVLGTAGCERPNLESTGLGYGPAPAPADSAPAPPAE